MSDLIRRQDAIDVIVNTESDVARETPFNAELFGVMAKRQHEILDMIMALPSADAVEVVRCKDCKHYLNEHICLYFSRHGTIETSSYAYCAYGERREP